MSDESKEIAELLRRAQQAEIELDRLRVEANNWKAICEQERKRSKALRDEITRLHDRSHAEREKLQADFLQLEAERDDARRELERWNQLTEIQCARSVRNEIDRLCSRLMQLEAICPKRYKLPDGRILIYRCPDDAVPIEEIALRKPLNWPASV